MNYTFTKGRELLRIEEELAQLKEELKKVNASRMGLLKNIQALERRLEDGSK